MHLRAIRVKGFKSFARQTELLFEPGVGVIIGPNGSGKSNLADAVVWALGEQSPSTMRGSSMQDVIFAGSDGRRASGSAEVELTLDNADGALPLTHSRGERHAPCGAGRLLAVLHQPVELSPDGRRRAHGAGGPGQGAALHHRPGQGGGLPGGQAGGPAQPDRGGGGPGHVQAAPRARGAQAPRGAPQPGARRGAGARGREPAHAAAPPGHRGRAAASGGDGDRRDARPPAHRRGGPGGRRARVARRRARRQSKRSAPSASAASATSPRPGPPRRRRSRAAWRSGSGAPGGSCAPASSTAGWTAAAGSPSSVCGSSRRSSAPPPRSASGSSTSLRDARRRRWMTPGHGRSSVWRTPWRAPRSGTPRQPDGCRRPGRHWPSAGRRWSA